MAQRLDIALEGPWIFSVDSVVNSKAQSVTVLIATAPVVPGHFPATFSTGDGVSVGPGVYCVGFDNQCAPQGAKSPDWAHSLLVQAKKPAGWDWAHLNGAYVFILPIPNSFSNDGVYPMTLRPSFPKPAATKPEWHSIGIQLHYDSGPSTLNLYSCLPLISHNLQKCATSLSSPDNSGTLRISIKTPEYLGDQDKCDYHVRRAYNKMLLLVDSTSLSGASANTNQDKAYVDLPEYYPECYACDPQQESINPDCMGIVTTSSPAMLDVNAELTGIIGEIEVLDAAKALNVDTKALYLRELRDEKNSLNGQLPKRSQLAELQSLLDLSADGIGKLPESPGLPKALRDIQAREQALAADTAYIFSALDGKDCRAPQMFIK
jgi:hypothetical protein